MTTKVQPTSAAVADKFELAKIELANAEIALSAFDPSAERRAALQGAEAIRRFRAKRDEAVRARDEATAISDAWAEEFQSVAAREEQARRRALYDALVDQLAEYRASYEAKYRGLCSSLVELLGRARHLDQAVEQVNATLPEGAIPLQALEEPLRHIAGVCEEVRTVAVTKHGVNWKEQEVVVRGTAPVRPLPLYDVFEAPGFAADDPAFRVPGTERPVL